MSRTTNPTSNHQVLPSNAISVNNTNKHSSEGKIDKIDLQENHRPNDQLRTLNSTRDDSSRPDMSTEPSLPTYPSSFSLLATQPQFDSIKDSVNHNAKDSSASSLTSNNASEPLDSSNQPAAPSASSSSLKFNHHSLNNNIDSPAVISVGLQADHVYRSQMSFWRFKMRSILLTTLNQEIKVLESIQRNCRTKRLDQLMIHSSWLGSHQFFIVTLPLIFWIGDHRLARSQVYILAMSVYFTGTLKDFFCIPRPYSPPINRLSISNHAAEYGFPSTHSATSSAIALVGLEYALHVPSTFHRIFLLIGLGLYEFLLVFGRVYCGMHSIQDVICGGGIGAFSWTIYRFFGSQLEDWVTSSQQEFFSFQRILVPLVLVISGLILTAAHPQPIEDCPCFEDSTAFVAVTVGVMIGHWIGHELIQNQVNNLERFGFRLRWPQAIIKLLLGLTILFGWRFVMKELLARLLPPIFKLCAPLLELPRRHYATTKDYNRYLGELREHRRRTSLRARLIPSVVHLPKLPKLSNTLKNRHATHNKKLNPHDLVDHQGSNLKLDKIDPPSVLFDKKPDLDSKISGTVISKRYDVDVLMRFIVYAGIGFLSSYGLPLLFNQIGLDN